jgi:hypothetical protein
MNRFPFVQFELTHAIGPAPGRYLVNPLPEALADGGAQDEPARPVDIVDELDDIVPAAGPPAEGAAASVATASAPPSSGPTRTGYEIDAGMLGAADVLVVRTIGAPPPKAGLFGRKGAPVAKVEDPRELAVTMATVIFGTRILPDAATTKRFYEGVQSDPDKRDQWVQAALVIVNRAIAAYRACAADPYVIEITTLDPRAIRLGHGAAELVSVGKWEEAVIVPPPPPIRLTRDERVMPTQALATVLVDKGEILESEELILRAVLDLEQGRARAAAVGFAGAFELLLGEFSGRVLAGSVRTRLEALMDDRDVISGFADAARHGPLPDADIERLAALVESAGALVDHWRYENLGYA